MYSCFFDGAANPNPGPMGVGVVLLDSSGNEIATTAMNAGRGTNNQAEYRALTEAAKLIVKYKVDDVLILGDSRLVINQMVGFWSCNNDALKRLRKEALEILSQIPNVEYRWIPRKQNERADELSKIGLQSAPESYTQDEVSAPIQSVSVRDIKSVIYHPGVGFSVVEQRGLYAVNLSPKLQCSCGNRSQCIHIQAALMYARQNRKVA